MTATEDTPLKKPRKPRAKKAVPDAPVDAPLKKPRKPRVVKHVEALSPEVAAEPKPTEKQQSPQKQKPRRNKKKPKTPDVSVDQTSAVQAPVLSTRLGPGAPQSFDMMAVEEATLEKPKKPFAKSSHRSAKLKKPTKKGPLPPLVSLQVPATAASEPSEINTPPDFSAMPPVHYGLIRSLCQAGAWRRGFGYYKGGQVRSVEVFTGLPSLIVPVSADAVADIAEPEPLPEPEPVPKKRGRKKKSDVPELVAPDLIPAEQPRQGISGHVKGNFKDSYHVRLFAGEAVHPATTTPAQLILPMCDCPLEEPWCKHAVAVALVGLEKNLWPYVFCPDQAGPPPPMVVSPAKKQKRSYASPFPVRPPAPVSGLFRVVFDDKRQTKHVCLKVLTTAEHRPVLNIEQFAQQHGAFFSTSERAFIEWLFEAGYTRANSGAFFAIPARETDDLFPVLAQLEQLVDAHEEPLTVALSDPLRLVMSVNASLAGTVLVSLHWIKTQAEQGQFVHPWPPEAFPLEEVVAFDRLLPWGRRRQVIYPLQHKLANLPHALSKNSFNDIRDSEGGKFLYEELPRLRKLIDVEQTDLLQQLTLGQRPPQKRVMLDLIGIDDHTLRASLFFDYDGALVPYHKSSPDSLYVMVLDKKAKSVHWVKRQPKIEQEAYQTLVKAGLEPLQTNHLQCSGDIAIDLANQLLPNLDDTWQAVWEDNARNQEAITRLKMADHPLQMRALIDFDTHVDHFTLQVTAGIGTTTLNLDEVQADLMQGKKYFYAHGLGYVEIPLASMLQFGKTLQSLDAEKLDTQDADRYRVATFKAGLLSELVEQGVVLDMSPRFNEFWSLITGQGSIGEVALPVGIRADLRHYQQQGFQWLWFLYTYGLNGILADDMGLGKTLQALTLIQAAKEKLTKANRRPSLIICPTSVVYNWEREARRFAPELKSIILGGSNRHEIYRELKEADLVITSYAIARRDILALKNYAFQHVILDESQNIKNADSQTAKAVKQLQAPHRLALSGTPIENRLSELWSVFDFLMPGFLYDLDEFRYRYIVPIEEKNHAGAQDRLRRQVAPFILRRMKKDVAQELPPKVESVVYCELTEKQQALYLSVLEQTRDQVFAQYATGDTANKGGVSILAALLRLRQVCCHPGMLQANALETLIGESIDPAMLLESGKFNALQELIEEIMDAGGRILLFSQFVEMLKLIQKWLEVKGIRYEILTGETKDRQERVDRFNNNADIPVFLMSLKAGGTGLNLTGADYVIHYDPWWNPAAEDQATDRAHRIGQTKTVFVYRMIARGTVEEKIVTLQDRKRDLLESVISADRAANKLMSFDDLKDILTPGF